MKPAIKLLAGPVRAKLIDAPRDVKLLINQELSFLPEGQVAGTWDGRSSFYDFTADTFPAGFYYRVIKALTKAGHRVLPSRVPAPLPRGPVVPVVDTFPEDPRYDFQRDVTARLLKHYQIVAQVATGGGKSRIARLAYRRLQLPTLFLTTRGILMHQMRDSFVEMGERCGILGDGYLEFNETGMNVGMVQTFAQAIELQDPVIEFERYEKNREAAELREVEEMRTRLSSAGEKHTSIEKQCDALLARLKVLRKDPLALAKLVTERVDAHNAKRPEWLSRLDKIEFLIGEEAHEASGNSFFDVATACKRAFYRLALTATPNMKDSQEANLRLEACFGPIGIKVTEKELIDSGILATPKFKFITDTEFEPYREIRKTASGPREFEVKLYRSTPWPLAYEIGIVKNAIRNRQVIYEATRAVKHGLSVMVLVQRQEHGKKMASLLSDAGVKTAFIYGENNQAERAAAIGALKARRIDVLIGSTILDVGVDVPAIGLVINASGGKAEVATRQRIGRGLRAKKAGPNIAFFVDFTDPLNNHIKDHARERRLIIETTPGFAENVVEDFDYSIFEAVPA